MRWLFIVSLLAVAGGCGDPDADDHPDVIAAGPVVASAPTEEPAADDVAVGPCKQEEKRECKRTLNVRNGITTCMLGEQRCELGRWSECRGKEKDDAAAGAAGMESK